MSADRRGLEAPSPVRSPWQHLYGWAHRQRRRRYRLRARRLPVPVWSVGNLHWGGTGKTPLIAAIAEQMQQSGLVVALLSRGYRRRGDGIRFVSRGEGRLLSVEEAGDEPAMLAEMTTDMAIVVGTDRYACGLAALSELQPRPDILLLDDGFSHLGLARDLDILTFPSSDPFAGGRLLPSGRLREPLSSVAAAQAVVLTRSSTDEDAGSGLGSTLARALQPFGFDGPGFVSDTHADSQPPTPAGARMLLVTGIARPARAASTAQHLGLAVCGHMRFADHHRYPARSLARIVAEFRRLQADYVLTTSKDRLKLNGRLALPLVELRIRATLEPAFRQWLDQQASISNSGSPPSTD